MIAEKAGNGCAVSPKSGEAAATEVGWICMVQILPLRCLPIGRKPVIVADHSTKFTGSHPNERMMPIERLAEFFVIPII